MSGCIVPKHFFYKGIWLSWGGNKITLKLIFWQSIISPTLLGNIKIQGNKMQWWNWKQKWGKSHFSPNKDLYFSKTKGAVNNGCALLFLSFSTFGFLGYHSISNIVIRFFLRWCKHRCIVTKLFGQQHRHPSYLKWYYEKSRRYRDTFRYRKCSHIRQILTNKDVSKASF